MTIDTPCTAFAGERRIASGPLLTVALAAKEAFDSEHWTTILVFTNSDSEVVDLDYSLTRDELERWLLARFPAASAVEAGPRRPGRPRLGVIAREITLLPRHWEWLATQPGGASVALRKLVEEARRSGQEKDRKRQAQENGYRFLSAMAGNFQGFETATRAFFAGDAAGFAEATANWPKDIREHALQVAAAAFPAVPTERES